MVTRALIDMQAGLKHIAVVLPPHGLGKFASQVIFSLMGDAIFNIRIG